MQRIFVPLLIGLKNKLEVLGIVPSDINGQGIEGLRPFHDLTVTQVLRIGCTRGGHTGAEVR